MKFNQFKANINSFKTSKLGGLDAQFKLAPELRLRYDADKIKASNPKKAAVLALFYPNENNETTFILTERASYKGTHSAQISFPGGKIDISDKNLEATAVREANEEIGIKTESVEIIRELTDVYIPPSNFLATPFIGYLSERPKFITNYEVETTIEVLLEDLLNDTSLTTVNLSTSYMKNTDVPCFKLNGYVVWGATAMMLSEIKELLKQ
ncbi:coenzyme A pyrophosphatase [Polaribacter sp. BM10]|uniref:NUDIX hydrolase n=1 Tax=Polaribacter sp. BM10 TaxID=1529069 RepID=UPI00098B3A68|nr:CoA pyrophosphatase [Polaribacter sp. BM10]AQS93042.1 coenzyme A pyrophosphatase [Polaribacter sp. BM10]